MLPNWNQLILYNDSFKSVQKLYLHVHCKWSMWCEMFQLAKVRYKTTNTDSIDMKTESISKNQCLNFNQANKPRSHYRGEISE